MNARTLTIALAAGLVAAAAAPARPGDADSTMLTIYSTAQPGGVPAEWYRPVPGQGRGWYGPQIPGYAVVKEERSFTFDAGLGELSFRGVAALLDPTTVHFESLDDKATKVLEQDYRFDLVDQGKLLERFIDHKITVTQTRGAESVQISGTLLSAAGGLVLQKDDGGVVTVSNYSMIDFPALPGGLLTRPTLVWKTWSPAGGEQNTRMSYQTTGITWWADYNLVFAPGENANSGTLDVGAWVSILNQSGGTFEDAKLKLIAGDVNRAPQPSKYMGGSGGRQSPFLAMEDAAGFEGKSFFEYHLYTLGRPATIPDNSTKQIELFEPARAVPAEKILVYDGADLGRIYGGRYTNREMVGAGNTKVDVFLRFKNDKDAGLGVPMPKGRIRVSQIDPADNSLEFIGEDVIDHTPRNETILIKLGQAFDVVGERKQTDFSIDNNRRMMRESIEVKIRNQKAEAVDVVVRETMYRWTNWRIVGSTMKHEKQDSRTIHFPVTIQPEGEVTISYTVEYTW